MQRKTIEPDFSRSHTTAQQPPVAYPQLNKAQVQPRRFRERKPTVAAKDPEVRRAAATKAGRTFAASRTQAELDAHMAHAREAQRQKLRAEVIDRYGPLPDDEIDRRVEQLAHAKLADISRRGVAARRARAEHVRREQLDGTLDALAQAEGEAVA